MPHPPLLPTPGSVEIMSYTASFALSFPEIILSVSAIVLMLAAAWAGDKASKAISWLSVAALVGAAAALLGPAGSGGVGYDGLYVADPFAAFAKLLIYIGAAVAILIAPGFFERPGEMRAELPVVIVLWDVGMATMVTAQNR